MWTSYSLWREFSPQQGLEEFHCHKKRGYSRVISKDDKNIARMSQQDTIPQKIGKLSQQAVYYLYNNPQYLNPTGIDIIASKFLNLDSEEKEVKDAVFQVLINYLNNPFLNHKKVISLELGNEKANKISLVYGDIYYALFFKFDCVIEEDPETIHIIDLKTGESHYDLRQAFVYLLVGKSCYKDKRIIASFYNLLSAEQSEIYSATQEELDFVKIRLGKIALTHDQQVKQYKSNPKLFNQLFPASPGKVCQQCPFNSVCKDYAEYVHNN